MSNKLYAAGLEAEVERLRRQVEDMETRARRYYLPDGSCIVCATEAEVVEKRVRAARIVEAATAPDFRDAVREWRGELWLAAKRNGETESGRHAQRLYAAVENYIEAAKGGS